CGLATRAYVRSTDWVDPRTFYERTMAAGKSSSRVAVNLGIVYENSGELQRAETVFRRVLQLTPDYPIARTNLAQVLYREGKRDEAEALLAQARAAAPEAKNEYPRTWVAALNLARIRHNEHDDDTALKILNQARADYPQIWQVIRFESEVLRTTIGPQPALRLVADYVRKNWWHHGATVALGQLLAEKGDVEAAVEQLRFASWLDVHDAEALHLIAAMRLRQNRFAEARVAQEKAVARRPDEPSQYTSLAEILLKMGCDAEAREVLVKVARLEAVGRAEIAAN
ncbi:MAG: tetratricopeptide repeat protein, partial [Chthoniobacterales bacterium]